MQHQSILGEASDDKVNHDCQASRYSFRNRTKREHIVGETITTLKSNPQLAETGKTVVPFHRASREVERQPTLQLEKAPRPCKKAMPPEYGQSVSALCEKVVSMALVVPLADLQSPNRCSGDVALARQIAMYLAHTTFSLTMSEVGFHFGRDRSTVSHACVVVEDKRDSLSFDLTVCQLETLLAHAQTAITLCLEQPCDIPELPKQPPLPSKPRLCDKLLPVRELRT